MSLTLNRFFLNLQREAEATGKFVLCLQLTKLKLGLVLCVFDSKPILLEFATRSRGNRKICSLPSTYKAEARFRVKTENHFEATNNEQFQPNPSEMFATRSWYNRKSISLPDTFKAVTHLPVCSFLVLTHNFEVGRPVIARMEMFIILGMLLQRG